MGVRGEGLDQGAEHGPEDPQWQARPGLVVRRAGEGAVGHQGHVVEGRVAVEHLEGEPVDDGGGGQEAVAPGVPGLSAGGVDGVAVESAGEVLPQGAEGGNNPVMLLHPRASCAVVSSSNAIVHRGPCFLKALDG
jgi:hypothetical protein